MSDADKAAHSAARWLKLPERGAPTMLRFMFWIATRVGRRAGLLLSYPGTLYYLLAAGAVRRASRDYLRRVLDREPGWLDVFRHMRTFAITILDRVYLLSGMFGCFDLQVYQAEIFHRQVDSGEGCILLGSHLGSFEILRTLGVLKQHARIRVFMDTRHNQNITRLLDSLNPEIADTVIAADRPDALLGVKESLDAGYLIGMLGDRAFGDGKAALCQFLGAPARFPTGPILLAAVMHCPIILFFGLYRGGNRYDVHFEKLADNISLSREHRAEDTQRWTQCYADRLAHYTRGAPYNWFNFYPFWDE